MNVTSSFPVENSRPSSSWGEAFACERELLGAVLTDPSLYQSLRDLVGPEDFSTGIHERLFEAIPGIIALDGSIDRSAVPTALGAYAWDAEGGVGAWLDGLQAGRAAGAEAVNHARAIHSHAERRRIMPEPIDIDAATWCHHQAGLLAQLAERSDPLSRQVDWQNVIGEILYVGRSQTSGVVRKIELVFEHLVKLLVDPDAPSRNRWRVEIKAFRTRIVYEATPGMRPLIDLDAAWRKGVAEAEADLAEYAIRLPRDLPSACPFTLEDLTTETLSVAGLLEKLAASGDMRTTDTP